MATNSKRRTSKRKAKVKLKQRIKIVEKNDKTRVALSDTLGLKSVEGRPPADVGATFKIRLKRKHDWRFKKGSHIANQLGKVATIHHLFHLACVLFWMCLCFSHKQLCRVGRLLDCKQTYHMGNKRILWKQLPNVIRPSSDVVRNAYLHLQQIGLCILVLQLARKVILWQPRIRY